MSANNDRGFVWERRIEFCETDAAGIVHFSSFFLYMEQAEHALFRALGRTIFPADFLQGGELDPPVTWPRVRCECEYFAPAKFEEVMTVRVEIERLGSKSITYRHLLSRGEEKIAHGRIVAVCSRHDRETGRLVGVVIPPVMREALSRYAAPESPDRDLQSL